MVIERSLEDHLNKQPKISDTSNKMFGKSMVDCLIKASNIKKDYGDQFVSIEHLVLALGT